MKRFKIIALLFLYTTQPCQLNSSSNTHSSHKKSILFAKTIFKGKLLFAPAILTTLLLYNQKNLFTYIAKNPIPALAGGCLICNFISDAIIKHHQLQRTLFLLEASGKMNRYMLYAMSIKNTMIQFSKKHAEYLFYEANFFQDITSQLPLSFQELEELIIEVLNDCIKQIQELHIDLQTNFENKIYLLNKNHLTIEDALIISKQDDEVHTQLERFHKNPSQHYQETLLHLNSLIKKHLKYMMNN